MRLVDRLVVETKNIRTQDECEVSNWEDVEASKEDTQERKECLQSV